jgi:hypothetical protein
MHSTVRTAAAGVARDLKAAETSVDGHIEATASLMASLVRNREAARVPFADLQLAIHEASQSMVASVESRRRLARAHVSLRKTSGEHGLTIAHGDVFPWCPPEGRAAEPEALPLRAVG